MYLDKSFLAIIPARGGSKGLPSKNIKKLSGKPLISWTIETAKKSKYLDKIMVTTDSQEIADIAKDVGAEVPFLRPDYLASDTATSFDAVKHTLDHYKEKNYDYVVLLEPTSPLREDTDIDKMIEKLVASQESADSIISIGEVTEHPNIMKKLTRDDKLIPYIDDCESELRRQEYEAAYFPYGVAYIVKKSALLSEESFYTKKNVFYKIQRHQCYEIDDIYDFICIESIIDYRSKL
jgi:N-acylneuraminate cytidylyltransferase/CMP-N,N'-diacetyllegionaminic acid synthase